MATNRGSLHLVLQRGHWCGVDCQEKASRLIRCRVGGCVIARCGTHGASMERVREEHEARCQPVR